MRRAELTVRGASHLRFDRRGPHLQRTATTGMPPRSCTKSCRWSAALMRWLKRRAARLSRRHSQPLRRKYMNGAATLATISAIANG